MSYSLKDLFLLTVLLGLVLGIRSLGMLFENVGLWVFSPFWIPTITWLLFRQSVSSLATKIVGQLLLTFLFGCLLQNDYAQGRLWEDEFMWQHSDAQLFAVHVIGTGVLGSLISASLTRVFDHRHVSMNAEPD